MSVSIASSIWNKGGSRDTNQEANVIVQKKNEGGLDQNVAVKGLRSGWILEKFGSQGSQDLLMDLLQNMRERKESRMTLEFVTQPFIEMGKTAGGGGQFWNEVTIRSSI